MTQTPDFNNFSKLFSKMFLKWLIANIFIIILVSLVVGFLTKEVQKGPTTESTSVENKESILLAKIINAECKQCPIIEKLYVGSVVLNRSRILNQTINTVIYSENQFHGVNNSQYKEDVLSILLAQDLLENGPIDSNIIFFYQTQTKYNDWRKDVEPIKILKYHTFSK